MRPLTRRRRVWTRSHALTLALRLLVNVDSVREGVQLALMCAVAGVVFGVAWAAQEIWASWTWGPD